MKPEVGRASVVIRDEEKEAFIGQGGFVCVCFVNRAGFLHAVCAPARAAPRVVNVSSGVFA